MLFDILAALTVATAAVVADAAFRRTLAASANTRDHRDGDALRRFYDEDAARGMRVVRRIE